jgi:hypothetical protein
MPGPSSAMSTATPAVLRLVVMVIVPWPSSASSEFTISSTGRDASTAAGAWSVMPLSRP